MMAKNAAPWAGLLLPFAGVGGKKEEKNERERKKGGGLYKEKFYYYKIVIPIQMRLASHSKMRAVFS